MDNAPSHFGYLPPCAEGEACLTLDGRAMEMSMDNVYTQAQIYDLWQQYKTDNWYKVLKAGKWVVRRTLPDMAAEPVTSCQMVKACDAVSFPKYLEMVS